MQAVPGAGSSVLRKPAALAEAAHTRPRSAAPMAAPGIFLVSVLLLCGPGPYPAAADSQPGKGAHGKATGPFCGDWSSAVMAGKDRMWGCAGWHAVVAPTRDPATPDVSQDLRHLFGPLQWGCQEGQAVPGSPVGVSLCPLQCWSISDPPAPWECSCPITLVADPIGLCYMWVLARMVSGSAPAALSFLVSSVVLCTGRGQDTEAFLSTWHSHPSHCFLRKNALLAWLSVKQQLSMGKAPLYPWTSWAGGKVPSTSRCRNSLFAPLCYITNQEL